MQPENPQPKKNNWIKSKIARIGSVVLIIGILAGVAYEAYQNDMIPGFSGIPSSYDTIKVGVGTQYATSEDLANLKDAITMPANPTDQYGLPSLPQLAFLMPFLLKDGEKIGMLTATMGGAIDQSTGKTADPAYTYALKFVVEHKNTSIIPGIIDPKAKSIEVFKDKPVAINGKEYFNGATILVTRNDGSEYVADIRSDDMEGLIPLPILNQAPIYEPNEKGITISGTTPIMETRSTNVPVDYYAARISSSFSTQDSRFSAIQLFESPNNRILCLPENP